MAPPRTRYVSATEIRRLFNEGAYELRAAAGEFLEVVRRDSHPTLTGSTEPFCTRSRIVAFVTLDGEKMVVAHRYLRRDGNLGGSGRPDPKMLRVGNVIFHVRPDADRTD